MSRLIRAIAGVLAAGVALVVLAVVALLIFIDPNDYRDDISTLARQQAGVELTLGGDLAWSFYPTLGFKAQGVTLAMAKGLPTLVEVTSLTVGVRLLPLLSKQVDIDALDVTGLKAQLKVDANGNNNWQPPAGANTGEAAAATAPTGNDEATATANADAALPMVRIPSLLVRDSHIHYQDLKAKLDYRVDLPLLQLTDVSLDQPFPAVLNARVRDNGKLDVQLTLNATLRADMAQKIYRISEIELDSTLGGIFAKPVSARLGGQITFDQAQDNAQLAFNRVQLADMRASMQIEASTVSTAPTFKGKFGSERFDLKVLLQALGMDAPVTRDPKALTAVEVTAEFAGTPERIAVKPLQLKLDDSTLSGELAITEVARQAVQFTLALDALDADRYLPPDREATAGTHSAGSSADATAAVSGGGGGAPAAAVPLLPVDALRRLNLKGKFTAGEIVINKIPVRALAIGVKAKDGDVKLNELTANLLQGTLAGTAGVDVRGAQPRITTHIDLQNLQLQELLSPWVSAPVLSGRSSMQLDTSTQGNDTDTLLRQALGQLDLQLAEGVLHGVNLNQLVIEALKQKIGDFTALMPDYETRLPKALKGDTALRNLLANMKVENGHLITPAMKASSEAGQLSASGDIDLLAQGFDYRLGVVLSALDDHKYLKGTEWPIRCRGSLDVPAKDWCRPDMNAMGKVLQQAAQLALREKATEKLGEKLGLPGASEAEVKAEVKQKAQEKINEQLTRQFDKWLDRDKKKAPAPAGAPPASEPATPPPAPEATTAPAP